jgi:serine/threonine protein kinase
VRFTDLETAEVNLKEKKILLGTHRNTGEMDFPCALKVATDPRQVKKLERERAILELISSRDAHHEGYKYIVGLLLPSQLSEESIFFFNKTGDQLFPSPSSSPVHGLVLECGGKNLREFLKNETLGSVPMTQRIHILEEVVEAVRFLHRLRIVHFDLKPENIVCFSLLGDKTRWKLIDFDSSFDEKPTVTSPSTPPLLPGLSSNSSAMDLWLTEEFICPEIASAVEQSSHSPTGAVPAVGINWAMDIWSLGMVAFFLFTNRSLWSDYSIAPFHPSMVSNVRQEEIQLILSRSLGYKEKSFVESCLRVDPLSRSNGTELLAKSLFSTNHSTVQADTMRLVSGSMLSRFDEIAKMVREYSDRCSPDLLSEELSSKLGELYLCLTTQFERISNMSREEIQGLLRAATAAAPPASSS